MWRTADGRDIPLNEISHQHASNIIWYYDLLCDQDHTIIRKLINDKFEGIILEFKPLPIPHEILDLHKKGLITAKGDIMNKYHNVIGSVTHIPNWQELIKL